MPENANRGYHLHTHAHTGVYGGPVPERSPRTSSTSAYREMVARVTAGRTGCARWLSDRWCNRDDELHRYQVGLLCPDHQPDGGG